MEQAFPCLLPGFHSGNGPLQLTSPRTRGYGKAASACDMSIQHAEQRHQLAVSASTLCWSTSPKSREPRPVSPLLSLRHHPVSLDQMSELRLARSRYALSLPAALG